MFSNAIKFLPLLLSLVNAQNEGGESCTTAAIDLNDIPEVNTNHEALIIAYDQVCHDAELCTHNIGAFPGSMNPALINMNTLINSGAIEGSADANFGAAFGEDPSVIKYRDSCNLYSGTMRCANVNMRILGEAGAAMGVGGQPGEGIQVDLELDVDGFPICLPRECEGDLDMATVIETEFKTAMLNSPEFQDELGGDSSKAAIFKATSFNQMCLLSGVETCTLDVEEVECDAGPGTVASDATSLTKLVEKSVKTFVTVAGGMVAIQYL